MIITRTPYRVSLFGGGSDFPDWFRDEPGSVIAGAIDKHCYITLRSLPPFFPYRYRIMYSRVETVARLEEIEHPAVRAALAAHLAAEGGFELHHDGDLPARSGLGSSSSFAVGLLLAIRAHLGLPVGRHDLAMEAIAFEQEVLRERVGLQDQVTAAYGGLNRIEFGPRPMDFAVRPLPLTSQERDDLAASLLLVYSGSQRVSSEVAANLRHDDGDRRPVFRRTVAMVDEFERLLRDVGPSADGFVPALGELLDESWRLKAEANPAAVTPSLAVLRDELLAAGARGVKVAGAGGGGFLLAVVPPQEREVFALRVATLEGCIAVPFRFEDVGSSVIHHSPDPQPLIGRTPGTDSCPA